MRIKTLWSLTIRALQHWWDDNCLRLAASITHGAVTASLMLRKLGRYPRQNGLSVALRELGRIACTLFMLDWLLVCLQFCSTDWDVLWCNVTRGTHLQSRQYWEHGVDPWRLRCHFRQEHITPEFEACKVRYGGKSWTQKPEQVLRSDVQSRLLKQLRQTRLW